MKYLLLLFIIPILPVMIVCRGAFKPFACWIGWHSYHYDTIGFDGCSEHAKCQWCGYEGMIDSQGNLF